MADDENSDSDKSVRDPLALERTALANERTLLSYIRTSIMLFATSVTLLYLANDIRVSAVGIAVFLAAVFTALFGTWRYRSLQRKIATEARQR
ncbi:MAG: DUF202 domain-containing protein [bacterium]